MRSFNIWFQSSRASFGSNIVGRDSSRSLPPYYLLGKLLCCHFLLLWDVLPFMSGCVCRPGPSSITSRANAWGIHALYFHFFPKRTFITALQKSNVLNIIGGNPLYYIRCGYAFRHIIKACTLNAGTFPRTPPGTLSRTCVATVNHICAWPSFTFYSYAVGRKGHY